MFLEKQVIIGLQINLQRLLMRFTIRYFLAAVALLGICLAIYPGAQLGGRFLLLNLAAFVIRISMLVHLATTFLKLKSWPKWLFATFVPTAGLVGWHVCSVEYRNQHPGSIGVYGFLTGGLLWFLIGFAIVNSLMLAINRIGDPKNSADNIG